MNNMMQLLTCTRCNRTWSRPLTSTTRPRLCDDCRAQPIPRQRTGDSPVDRRVNRLDTTSPGYQLAAKNARYVAAMVLAYRAILQKRYEVAEKALLEAIPDGSI